MRISELAEQSSVPVATIKYYLRIGLLHDGRLTAPRQAQYDDGHVGRLRLIRALLGPGGLSVAEAGKVLQQLDDPPESAHDLLGIAAHAAAVLPEAGRAIPAPMPCWKRGDGALIPGTTMPAPGWNWRCRA